MGVAYPYEGNARFYIHTYIDSNLSWFANINLLSTKVSRNAGIIYNSLKGIVPQSILKILYDSFVQSHLNYCSSVWGLGSKSSLQPLYIAQKKSNGAM